QDAEVRRQPQLQRVLAEQAIAEGVERRDLDVGTVVAALKCSTWGDIALVDARDVDEALAGGPDVRR
ncbi:MAG TPA: hypothetical protein VNN07_17285, partial [Candidatus Tectomicrobia bacterium]|nr:hypothetical protein [Candidatus Tectomicrobia bacterium]